MPVGKGRATPKPNPPATPPAPVLPNANVSLFDMSVAEYPGHEVRDVEPEPKSRTLADVLPELAKKRERLSKLDSDISALIKSVESALREHISVRVSTELRNDGDLWSERLSFGKWDNKWQLLVESGMLDDDSDWKTVPLLSCTREMRTKVFVRGHLQELIFKALDHHDSQISEREEALELGMQMLSELSGKPVAQ